MKHLVFVHPTPRGAVDHTSALSGMEAAGSRVTVRVVEIVDNLPSETDRTDQRLVSFGFDEVASPFREDRERRLSAVLAAGAGNAEAIDWQDPVWKVITMIADANAVLVVGTGATGSLGYDFYELSAIVTLARSFAKPVVLAQQGLVGPLDDRDQELIVGAFGSAELIGVVDEESRDRAVAWGASPDKVRVDPLGLFAGAESTGATSRDLDGYVVAHFGALEQLGLYRRPITELLERLKSLTGLKIVSSDADPGVIAGASLVISTSDDDLAIALSKAVPFVGLSTDETAASLAAQLDSVGMSEWAVSPSALGNRDIDLVLDETWTRRAEIHDHLSALAVVHAAAARQWWDDAFVALQGGDVSESHSVAPRALQLADRALAERITFARAVSRASNESRTLASIEWRARVDELGTSARAVIQAEQLAGELQARLLDANARVEEAEAALRAAQSLAAEVAEPAFARALRRRFIPYLGRTVTETLRPPTMRWARRIYGRVRFRVRDRNVL